MPTGTLVATGQITIYDTNDARPISAVITANVSTQQIYTKDESATSYVPDYAATPLVLTAKVYAGATGSAQDVTASLANKKWSTDLVTSIGSAATFTRSTNLTPGAAAITYYFEADYTDPVTSLTQHVMASIVVSQVKTGTNAVFLLMRGQFAIEEAVGSSKNSIRVIADLVRAGGVDDTGVTYRWFRFPHAASDQVDGNLASVTTLFGLQDTLAANANRTGVIGQYQTGSGTTTAAISTANVPDGGWVDAKALIIGEAAVTDLAVFKLEAKDTDGTVYQTFFTVYDVSDPYTLEVISTAGTTFQNGNGTTTLYPRVYYGSGLVSDTTGWNFQWTPYDKDGNRIGYVDSTRTALAGGRTISSHTTGASATFSYSGAGITVAAGDIIKCQRPDGTAAFYEIAAAATASPMTIRTPVTNTWLGFAAPSATTDFASGKLFVCTASGLRTTTGGATAKAGAITFTGDECDFKSNSVCEAYRP